MSTTNTKVIGGVVFGSHPTYETSPLKPPYPFSIRVEDKRVDMVFTLGEAERLHRFLGAWLDDRREEIKRKEEEERAPEENAVDFLVAAIKAHAEHIWEDIEPKLKEILKP